MSPDIKGDCVSDHYTLLWACVFFDNQAGSFHYPGRLWANLQLSSGHSWKWHSALMTICLQLAQPRADQAQHHFYWTWQCSGVRGKCHYSWWEYKFYSFNHVPRIMLDTYVQVIQWIVDNDKSGVATAALIIILNICSTVALGRLLPF